MKRNSLFILILLFVSAQIFAQPCPTGQLKVKITIRTDAQASETSWTLKDGNYNLLASAAQYSYQNNQTYVKELCVPSSTCLTFLLKDSYGDGINQPGFCTVKINDVLVDSVAGSTFGVGEFKLRSKTLNCAVGQSCDKAIPVTVGNFTAPNAGVWYVFKPDSVGSYKISTCANNVCDTKIWVYDNCILEKDTNILASLYYNDDNSECGKFATLNSTLLNKNRTYFIRIGSKGNTCTGTPIQWTLSYNGQIAGCTDPTSCNYNPIATISNNSCIPQGSPNCQGADLRLNEPVLRSTAYLTTVENTDPCLINEGCLNGYGVRNIVRFATRIENIGQEDFVVGDTASHIGQFSFDNCHNHNHYVAYAEYLLYNQQGNRLPSGYKNGFCVVDYDCAFGTTKKYNCEYMGLSKGCADIYDETLPCQWIDVTDTPDGIYTFVARVNWQNKKDLAGRVEANVLNNWAQLCFRLDRSSGILKFTKLDSCQIYKDCAGVPYGSAARDCNGTCNGTALRGDLDNNGLQNMFDAQAYVNKILDKSITAAACNDLNGDGKITVFDAALLANCLNYTSNHPHTGSAPHNHCLFPYGAVNVKDTVGFRILNVNPTAKYIDIAMRNPKSGINAYQFKMKGLSVQSVENLLYPTGNYPASVNISLDSSMVIGISYQDSSIKKSAVPQAFCRIRYAAVTEPLVCIEKIIDVVNANHERVISKIEGSCMMISSNSEAKMVMNVQVQPNPFNQITTISFGNSDAEDFYFDLLDATGRVVRSFKNVTGEEIIIERDRLPNGIYFYHLYNQHEQASGKLVLAGE